MCDVYVGAGIILHMLLLFSLLCVFMAMVFVCAYELTTMQKIKMNYAKYHINRYKYFVMGCIIFILGPHRIGLVWFGLDRTFCTRTCVLFTEYGVWIWVCMVANEIVLSMHAQMHNNPHSISRV